MHMRSVIGRQSFSANIGHRELTLSPMSGLWWGFSQPSGSLLGETEYNTGQTAFKNKTNQEQII